MPGEGGYQPKPGEVAGVDLFGERQEDGSIKLGTFNRFIPGLVDDRTHLPTFPDEITVAGTTYGLEFVKENDWEGRAEVEKNDPSDYRLSICWGVYV